MSRPRVTARAFGVRAFRPPDPAATGCPSVAPRTAQWDRWEGGAWHRYQGTLNPETGIYDVDVREVT